MYCSQCGSKLIKTYKFCTKCGAKIRTVVEKKVTKNDSSASTKFFNDYFDHKNNERTGFFKRKERKRRDENPKSKKSTSKFSFFARETFIINIGLMECTDKNDYNLGPIRGSRLPVKVQKVSQLPKFFQQEF